MKTYILALLIGLASLNCSKTVSKKNLDDKVFDEDIQIEVREDGVRIPIAKFEMKDSV